MPEPKKKKPDYSKDPRLIALQNLHGASNVKLTEENPDWVEPKRNQEDKDMEDMPYMPKKKK